MINLNCVFSWFYKSSGMEIKFTNWATNEPNNGAHNPFGSSQNCASIGKLDNEEWDDYYCDEPNFYLCEKELE